jgi:DNA polymerase III subunit epsilon
LREVVLDTETTGLDPKIGHRIIEIGAIELINHIPTDKQYHCYINPEREIDQGALEIHGLSEEFLKGFDTFDQIADKFLEFIKNDPLIIHNAPFDISFLNAELIRYGYNRIAAHRVIDTLPMARNEFPGGQVSLNALCRKYSIDNAHRGLHGALVDADLLASVYLELVGGKQPGLTLTAEETSDYSAKPLVAHSYHRRKTRASSSELKAHKELLKTIPNAIWDS